jgi:endoribonuclease Dicer
MTPAILVDRLVCESLRLQDIPLLVFDEAHHCRKANPYKQIMQIYDGLPPTCPRPHIFGMTACPVNRKVRPPARCPVNRKVI